MRPRVAFFTIPPQATVQMDKEYKWKETDANEMKIRKLEVEEALRVSCG